MVFNFDQGRNRMFRFIILTTLLSSSVAHAACLPDSSELGDIGPESQLVCTMLESRSPDSEISILDRRIGSRDKVSVIIEVNGRAGVLNYRLIGADWILTEPVLVTVD